MSARIPLSNGWSYEITSAPGAREITLGGHRDDTPAGLPLVTAGGHHLGDAMANLQEAMAEWDREHA